MGLVAEMVTGPGWIMFEGGPDELHQGSRGRLHWEPDWTDNKLIKSGPLLHLFRLTVIPLSTGGAFLGYVWQAQWQV